VPESSLGSTSDGMTAPPSTAYKVVDTPQLYKDVIQRYGVQGSFVGGSEVDSPWVPFGDNAAIRYCREHGIPINPQLYL
jgi:hypothetical protein